MLRLNVPIKKAPMRFSAKALNLFRIVLPLIILIAGVVGVVLMIVLQKPPDKLEDTSDKRPIVETVSIENVSEGIMLSVDGQVVPFREIKIVAQVSGKVIEKSESVRAGSYVVKGQILMQIDPTDYRLAVDRFQLELETAEQAMVENETEQKNVDRILELSNRELVLQHKELKRIEDLVESRAVSESEADQARRSTILAETAVAQLENQGSLIRQRQVGLTATKNRAQVALRQANIDLERTNIVAPVDGVIAEAPVEKDSFVALGEKVFQFEDTTRAEVLTHLRASDLYWLWQQQNESEPVSVYHLPQVPARIIFRIGKVEYHWDGVMVRYDGSGIDPRTRTVPCRIEVAEPKKNVRTVIRGDYDTDTLDHGVPVLLRGMFVAVEIAVKPDVPLLRIPDLALQPGNRIFIVSNEKLSILSVDVVRFETGSVVLRADSRITDGAQVVVSPLGHAEAGMEVKTKQSP